MSCSTHSHNGTQCVCAESGRADPHSLGTANALARQASSSHTCYTYKHISLGDVAGQFTHVNEPAHARGMMICPCVTHMVAHPHTRDYRYGDCTRLGCVCVELANCNFDETCDKPHKRIEFVRLKCKFQIIELTVILGQ